MKIIGITGGIGSGKSTVSSYLTAKGYPVYDADEMSRGLTRDGSPVLKEIGAAFGEDLIRPNGSLDRQALARVVFADPEKRRTLEAIVTARVGDLMTEALAREEKKGTKVAFMDVPLLFETGWDSRCDQVWVVTAAREVRIRRVMDRDGLSLDQVEARMRNQMPDEEKTARAQAVIDNSGSRAATLAQLDVLTAALPAFYGN